MLSIFSLYIAIDVNIDALNSDLPSDIRIFGLKRVTPTFNVRYCCSARTYSYTLPTIAFSHYNDQSEMNEYRVTAEQLQRVNDTLAIFHGQTNFHNYTVKKLFFDRSSERFIHAMECGRPFVEHDVEFVRITVTGSSFMLHQIRKMIGFTLAVVRGVIDDDMLKRSLTKEEFYTPTAPGLGLMLERLHFYDYAHRFKTHDPLTFNEFDDAVERFRCEQIHPFIIGTEIREQSMVNWFEYLMTHSFDPAIREKEENCRLQDESQFNDEWGENDEFVEKLKKQLDE